MAALVNIILVGNAKVGKTSLCKQFVDQHFPEDYLPTVGIDLSTRTIDNAQFKIWDTASDKTYQLITNTYYANKDIYIIVLSNDDKEALTNLQRYEHSIEARGRDPDATKLVVVNKCDLQGLTTDEEQKRALDDYCEARNLPIHYISATKHNEVESFFKAAGLQHLRKKIPEIEFKSHEQKSQSVSQPQTKALFDNYLKWYKFRLFGTHHINRAKAVKAALMSCEKNDDKLKIINNQIGVLNRKPSYVEEAETLGLDKRWARPNLIINMPNIRELYNSGYYRELLRIKDELERAIKSEEKQAEPLSSSSLRNGQ